ncbi:MAG TPA: TerC family protein [Planctomycetota bacterium]|nr:TerC family protein [Planctomycetota bacterium]
MQHGEAWVALATLTTLEIILGIDNVIFISILSGKVPEADRQRVRKLGLLFAMLSRVALLFALSWIMRLTATLFTVIGAEISGRDLILIAGGLFLLAKSTLEIHHKLEGDEHETEELQRGGGKIMGVLIQIALLDLVFSFDSVITAVGMAEGYIEVMILAVMISVGVMILFVNAICDFVERNPTFKILALSFLILIGVSLLGEGLDFHIPKGYVYFAMAFSFVIELLNMRLRKKTRPVALRGPKLPTG